MNSFKLMSALYKFVIKQFVYIPKIQFLGRRSKLDHQKENVKANPKQESPNYSQNFMDTDIYHLSRPTLTDEEISIVNNGGDFNIPDWNQIKPIKF